MALEPPIIVWARSRTGSSLACLLFMEHGLWTAKVQPQNTYGYTRWGEYDYLRDKYLTKSTLHDPKLFKKLCEDIVPVKTRWVVKIAIERYLEVKMVFPDSYDVFVKRNLESATQSVLNKNGRFTYEEFKERIANSFALMDEAYVEHGGAMIDMDQILAGDYETLKKAFEYCRVPFDSAIADKTIKPDMWHYRYAN
jgi:hypothetical protein